MKSYFLVFTLAGLISCGEKNPNPAEPSPAKQVPQDTTSTAKQYFPVRDFLTSEIAYVDSLPVGIMKYRSSANHSDSGYIDIKRIP